MKINRILDIILTQGIRSKTNLNKLPHISKLPVLLIREICLWQPIFVQFDLLIHNNTQIGSLFITLLIVPYTQEAE